MVNTYLDEKAMELTADELALVRGMVATPLATARGAEPVDAVAQTEASGAEAMAL